jgi:hypothetical protein
LCCQHTEAALYGVQLINRSVFALLGTGKLDIFIVPGGTNRPQLRWTFPYESSVHGTIRLGRLIPSQDVTALTFSIGGNVYALRVPHDVRNRNATLAQGVSPLQGHDSFVNLQGFRNCSANVIERSPQTTQFDLGVHLSHSLGVHAGHARLPERARPENSHFILEYPYETDLFDIVEFDEWAGVVVLVTNRLENGQFDQDYATILSIPNLGPHILDSMCA